MLSISLSIKLGMGYEEQSGRRIRDSVDTAIYPIKTEL
jgi:hypothetical protein